MACANPFDPDDHAAYLAWRAAKLDAYPRRLDELIVPVRDPRALTAAERDALLDVCRRANMAVYASRCGEDPDKAIPRLLGAQLGLERLQANWLADEDGISSITPRPGGTHGEFAPYTDRALGWHTDGYYLAGEDMIRGFVLHCVRAAAAGGESELFDHELAYIRLRDADPALVRALMREDALSIPSRTRAGRVARAAAGGPVFAVHNGFLAMRYTARMVNAAWGEEPAVGAARQAMERLLREEPAFVFRLRLEAGMGLVCNNVLHRRSGFTDSSDSRRLLYRARYFDRVGGAKPNLEQRHERRA